MSIRRVLSNLPGRVVAGIAVVATALVTAGAAPAAADELQLPQGKWWESELVQSRVQLTQEQQQQIRDLVYNHAQQMIDLVADVKKAELELKDLADRPELDIDAIRASFARFQKARQVLERERFELILSVRQTLSAEQWKILSALRRDRARRRPDGPRSDTRPRVQRPSRAPAGR